MATRHKNVRLDDDLQDVVDERRELENCDESAAIRSLMLDGAKAPRPRPVVAQVARPRDLDALLRELAEWRRDFAQVKNRLACYQNIAANRCIAY